MVFFMTLAVDDVDGRGCWAAGRGCSEFVTSIRCKRGGHLHALKKTKATTPERAVRFLPYRPSAPTSIAFFSPQSYRLKSAASSKPTKVNKLRRGGWQLIVSTVDWHTSHNSILPIGPIPTLYFEISLALLV